MRLILLLFIVINSSPLAAYEAGDFFIDPHVAVGFNTVQGTHLLGGLDLGYALSEQLAFGVHGYYAAGEHPSHDREMGGGPFLGYTQPLTSFLVGHVRQEFNYVDLYVPLKNSTGEIDDHRAETGTTSVTSAGMHLSFTPNFGFAVGYRLVLALANSDLDDGRSGFFVGFSIGI